MYAFSLLNNANPTAYWLLRHIFSHRDLLAKLRIEVAPVFTTGNSIATLGQVQYLLNACPLLRAFYDETLRLHSSSSSNRVVVEETSVGGYTLKVGHNIICPSYVQHHLPEHFGEAPEKFDPERFIRPGMAKGTAAVADSKMIRAFGGGISLCPGRFFAGNEVLSYAASILWRFDITFNKSGLVAIVPRKCEQTSIVGL
jgi:cytochrome P450